MIESVSEANGIYQKIQDAKRDKSLLAEVIKSDTENLVSFLRQNGPVLVYKDEQPHMIEAVQRSTIKLDKSMLATELGEPASELKPVRMAELVEDGRLAAKMIGKHEYEEIDYRLKQRKARKKEIGQFQDQK